MTSSASQVQLRRDTNTNVDAYTGPQGEAIYNTDTKRLHMQDGATAGGIPMAKLSEVQTFGRRTVVDANATIAANDVIVSMTAITATRTWALPAAASYPPGLELTLQDESGAVSLSMQIIIAPNGTDTIQGLSSISLSQPYNGLRLRSNGVNGWYLADGNPGIVAQSPHGGGLSAVAIEQLTTLSGPTTSAAIQIPNPCIVFGVSMRVITAIAGATSFSIGEASSAGRFGSGLPIAAGSTNFGMIGPNPYYGSNSTIIFTAAGGNFTGGVVRTTIYGFAPLTIQS